MTRHVSRSTFIAEMNGDDRAAMIKAWDKLEQKRSLPSMRIELISEDIYSFAEVISEYETSVLTVKLRGRI